MPDDHVKKTNPGSFIVRFPEGMRSRISDLAFVHGCSMHTEIIDRLACSLSGDDPLTRHELASSNPELSSGEQEILRRFRLLSRDRQNAFLTLIGFENPENGPNP